MLILLPSVSPVIRTIGYHCANCELFKHLVSASTRGPVPIEYAPLGFHNMLEQPISTSVNFTFQSGDVQLVVLSDGQQIPCSALHIRLATEVSKLKGRYTIPRASPSTTPPLSIFTDADFVSNNDGTIEARYGLEVLSAGPPLFVGTHILPAAEDSNDTHDEDDDSSTSAAFDVSMNQTGGHVILEDDTAAQVN